MNEEMKEPSCVDARKQLQAMYPGYMIAVSCNIHDDDDRQYWAVQVSEMKPPKCAACQSPEKARLATVYVAKSFADALADTVQQMEKGHGIVPVTPVEFKEVANG